MDITSLRFNDKAVKAALIMKPDYSLVATTPITICFPKRYEKIGLADVYDSVSCIGMVGIISGQHYASISSLCRFIFKPGEITEEVIDNEPFTLLHFEAGETIIESLRVPVNELIIYDYFNEFVKYARIPWYTDFEKILSIIDSSKSITGNATGSCAQAIRVLYSLTCRDKNNPDQAFRYNKQISNYDIKPLVIGMNNPSQLLSGAFSRFSGGYLNDNTIAAILETNEETTQVEEILKGIQNE